ncbi:ubiquitin carboxyl-terminal hydrolase 8 [Orussus abietinus]|uniref:ubiquitin carboxyl-terminal hydrolase 8 n=1 Tax=Orussus abietinus TaxID=222816 RepID=UPI0006258CCE|nr:ubiquitin carboxyl-terminal hydrolase 8 [Orussus abietinus]
MMSDELTQAIQRCCSMSDLIKLTKVNIYNKTPSGVCKKLPSVKDRGEKAKKAGERKKAYVLFKRWLNTVEWLKKTREYKENEKLYTAYVPNTQINEVKRMVEELSQTLEAHYETEITMKKVAGMTTAVDTMQIDPEPIKSHNGTIDLTANNLALVLPETPTDDPSMEEESITCVQLFHLMQMCSRFLVIDIRPQRDFQASKLTCEACINIPADQIQLGVLASSFEKYFQNDKRSLQLFKNRGKDYIDTVILMDWNTTHVSLTPKNPLNTLKEILKLWDPSVTYKKIVILDGGFSEWLNCYPPFVSNPNVQPPRLHENAMDEILEEVEYPIWMTVENDSNSIRMKTNPIPPRTLKPVNADKKQPVMNILSDNRSTDEQQSLYNTYNSYISANNYDKTSNSIPIGPRTVSADIVSSNKNEKSVFENPENGDIDMVQRDKDDSLNRTNKAVSKSFISDSVPKPFIDRSNKPNIKGSTVDSKSVLMLMKQLNEVTKCLEKFEKEMLITETELCCNEENKDPNKEQRIRDRIKSLNVDLEEMKKRSTEIKENLAEYKKIDVTLSPTEAKEKDKLDLSIGSAEQQIKTIFIERKKLYNQLEEKERMKVSSMQKQNESDIYKEPLKTDGPSTTSGLKRSHSSPNLAQLDIRKAPQVDRSSKPQLQRNQNDIHDNTNIKHSQQSWRDRQQRMDPIFQSGPTHPGITGLKNLGNSCYMNSIIQCLSNTASLAEYFNDNMYVDDLNTSNDNGTHGQVAEEVAQVIKALWRGQYKSISPRDLKGVIGQYKLQFDGYEQQDSHEFLTFLLDWMHNDLKRKVVARVDGPLSIAEKEWDKAMGGQQSIISQLFFGQLRSSIFCATCGNSSTTYETFNSLTMSLPSIRCNLDGCIKKFLSEQKVSGWKCPNCKMAREATKKFDFVKLAPILVIHLNRFGESDGWLEKRNTAVDFPFTNFNLKPYLVADNDARPAPPAHHYNYSLYAMSNHYGTMQSGHYTAFCKSAAQNKWYKYDDQTVTEASPTLVKSQKTSAYLLFYTSYPNDRLTFI